MNKGHKRIAMVVNTTGLDDVNAYLPSNYYAKWLGGRIFIIGHDEAGWTLDDYVIPRLASGLITAKEVEG